MWLRALGYGTGRTGMRLNTDYSSAALERLEERLERAADRFGPRVAIVGQSRGGILARALAVRRPDLVAGIVTLGSPLTEPLALHPLVRLNVEVAALLGRFGVPGLFTPACYDGDCCAELREEYDNPFPDDVGFVSVYSRSDGIVRWESCLDPEAEHVAVDASHCGISVHPGVYPVIGEALAGFAAAAPARPRARSA